jgi:hypothetical protein
MGKHQNMGRSVWIHWFIILFSCQKQCILWYLLLYTIAKDTQMFSAIWGWLRTHQNGMVWTSFCSAKGPAVVANGFFRHPLTKNKASSKVMVLVPNNSMCEFCIPYIYINDSIVFLSDDMFLASPEIQERRKSMAMLAQSGRTDWPADRFGVCEPIGSVCVPSSADGGGSDRPRPHIASWKIVR